MASMTHTITAKDAVNYMRSVELEIDLSGVQRHAFGIFQWRARMAVALMRLAACVLRCGIRVSRDEVQ